MYYTNTSEKLCYPLIETGSECSLSPLCERCLLVNHSNDNRIWTKKKHASSECNETQQLQPTTLPFSMCILLESCPPSWPARSPSFGPGKIFGDKPINIWFMERPFWWTAASTCKEREQRTEYYGKDIQLWVGNSDFNYALCLFREGSGGSW